MTDRQQLQRQTIPCTPPETGRRAFLANVSAEGDRSLQAKVRTQHMSRGSKAIDKLLGGSAVVLVLVQGQAAPPALLRGTKRAEPICSLERVTKKLSFRLQKRRTSVATTLLRGQQPTAASCCLQSRLFACPVAVSLRSCRPNVVVADSAYLPGIGENC